MDDVIRVLANAVVADSTNPDLRAYLARLLADKGWTVDGLECAQQGLVTNPAHPGLLSVAADSARHLGLAQEAEGYDELLSALGRHPQESDLIVPDSVEELIAAWDEPSDGFER